MRLLDILFGKPAPTDPSSLHPGEVRQMEASQQAREAAEAAIARHLRRERQAGRPAPDPARALRHARNGATPS